MPHIIFEGNICKYILTGAHVASRQKVTRLFRPKKAGEVSFALGET